MIVLIDLGHVFWRHWHATGSDVQAYELTVETCDWYRREFDRVAVCCDSPRSKRCDIAPDYKAHRKPKPPEAVDSLRSVQGRVKAWGVPLLSADGYEADDLIATLCAQADAEFEEVQIISNDKDLYQLLSPLCRMSAKGRIIGPAECVEKFGVGPELMRDWLTLTGDTADNIAGCPHVGPGRATDLLMRFGSLDAALAASDEEILSVPGVGLKTLGGLRAWDPSLARSLVTLMTDAPVILPRPH